MEMFSSSEYTDTGILDYGIYKQEFYATEKNDIKERKEESQDDEELENDSCVWQ